MAAEMPVTDVLCEAMEYLSKLGANLRTRSVNLQQKKIRKDKLTNSLAVQKAADKVLLICELSKKSLANVEAGMRKVLDQIVISQASTSVGGKSSSSKTSKRRDDKPKYHYLVHKSRRLKIKSKISLKHYESVRVLARKMSLSMLVKYPVYHDCKLYRKRRNEQPKKPIEDSTNVLDDSESEKDGSDTVPPENRAPSDQKENNRRRSSEKTQRRNSKSRITQYPVKKKSRVINELCQDQDTKQNNRKEGRDNDDDSSDSKNNEKASGNISDEHETNKSCEEPQSKKMKISKTESKQQNNDGVVSLDSDDETRNSIYKNDSESERIKRADNKNDSGSDSKKEAESKNDTKKNNMNDTENDSVKPIIKCVSLSKLLKPDVLKKDPIISPIPKNTKKVNGKKIEFDVTKKDAMLQKAKTNKDKFWALKRKEVSTFKPKKHVINITRLPELSTEFLLKHNLKKVTKNGDTICEITEDKSDAIVEEQMENSKKKTASSHDEAQLIAKENKVKNALLNESDSDNDIDTNSKPEKESDMTVDRMKKALLNSDSDQNEDSDISSKAKKQETVDNDKDDDDKDLDKETSVNDEEIISDKNSKSDSGRKAKKQETVKTKECSDNSEERISTKNSQSDSDEKDKKQKTVKTKDTSVNDEERISDKNLHSHSDKNEDVIKAFSDSEAAKNDLLNKSDSDNKSEKSDKSCKKYGSKDRKTPQKELVAGKDDNAKTSLLNNYSDNETEVPLDQRKAATPQSKKKRIRESVHAKNALLRYSSGSETEDEKLRNTLNEIKKSLLEGMSDDENKLKAKSLDKQRRSSQEFSSSSEDILIKKVKKKKSHASNSSLSKKKQSIISDSEEEKMNGSSDGDAKSTSSNSKMVRSKGKPGNSSSHSSDAQDPNVKDIDGLTNLRTLNKLRRRNSGATDKSESSNSTATNSRMAAKPTGLISEDILEAESSSDAPSYDGDDAEAEDLPTVSLSGFNGGLEHLVKEDLLVDSDSSVSNKEENKDDSDEEERLNAKRRKANAIASSDSETSTVVKKDKDEDVRLSDDNSDDSDVAKRTKRKKKGSDSDASAGSSDTGKKKRRRIKSVNDSDASGSDSENDGKNKHGRKNIRKVMGKNQLEEATKKAARQEKERVARIAERQKIYNNLQFDESGKPDEVVLDKVVLDFDPETKEPLIAVDRGIVKKLKPHQANGIKFMWDACFESVKRIKKDKGSGCILAHCMGLGKTLQVVALTHTLLAHDSLTKVQRVLVVCPLSTVLNWVNEFKMWLKFAERDSDIDVYELSRYKQNGERSFQLSQWFEHGGVCVLGYEMFRNLSADNNKKFKKKMLKNFQDALVDPGPDLVVCDEGHLLKNEKTSLSQSMNKVKTLRRIVLTGTPLQNNLKEYYCMVQFVKPNLLGKYNEYLNRFVNPITNGQYTDSTDHDIKIMKRRSHVLHKMLDGAVQRRDYGVLAPFLPPKHEYVLFITLTEVQTKLYQYYLDNYSRRSLSGKSTGFLFPDFQSLQRIWTHPLVLKYNSERYEVMQQKKRDKEEEDSEGSLVDFIDDDSTPAESSSEESSDDSSGLSDDSRKKAKKKKSSKKSKGKDKDKDSESAAASRRRGTRANPIDLELAEEKLKDEDILEVRNENPTEWWIKLVEEDVLEDLRNSHKLVLLFDILRQCETIGDKLLVFSQSLYSLDLIEHFLGKVDEATQAARIDEKLGGHVGSWSPGIDYFRLDGSTSCENRSIWCKNFNREDNPRARLFLISTRAGGLGINLVAANRVVIFDVSWNPSHDVQSIFRVYRFGQKKPCYVYRFLAMGTMEEKIYERQVTKQAISKRVIDEQQIDRHYAENDLAELYKFEAEPPSPRPLPPLPKDRLFAEMLREHEAQIYKYHEHDSLLENKEEETLSEEERKAAWEDFENEKNRPPPAPFVAPWPMNGMMPNLLAQQQQQLAYAALAAMLRKDMPNVNDNQIRDMLPMIYNANPALMQKMSEIYKYSQQMNMTPGMMAQGGMNPGSGGGALAGMGSTSGLQYEPPWQRQQQQQQQMRLQQLMSQQQSMGAAAKFYSGGLGSRDPVAMALQQQRAREIMVAGGAGRPRGRPPMQPRGPPAPSADVVNLDSD